MNFPSPKQLGVGLLGAVLALASAACTSSSNDFISDSPLGGNHGANGAYDEGAGGAGTTSTSTGTGGDDAGRAISEADIIQIDGSRLYALSQYGGLSIIDMSTKDHLRLLGRYRSNGMPFEMYLRGDTVYALFSGFGQYVCTGASDQTCTWVQSSHIEALAVADAAHVTKLGSYDLPGDIADSRIVGDVLYAVTYENGTCWNCQTDPNTTITSLNVHDSAHIAVVDRLTYTAPDPDGYGWWQRSIAVNENRMYVGGVDWDGYSAGHSTIQVVDISDPNGHLVKGATVQTKGQIESRWQMDETNGVLRVISQPGVWETTEVPAVETFQVASATQVTKLGELNLTLPKPERLRSVSFDGSRAYAITSEQTDPLFTIDLERPRASGAGRRARHARLGLLHAAARRPAPRARLRAEQPRRLARRLALRRVGPREPDAARARPLRR